MSKDRRRAISIKSRLVYGMVEVLREDITRAKERASKYDFIGLCRALYDTKETIQMIRDNIAELEYDLYLLEEEVE